MYVNFISKPETAKQFQIVDVDTGEVIENVASADDETGEYSVYRMRQQTLQDGPFVDLRLRSQSGGFRVDGEKGNIAIIDLGQNPMKAPLLALLDDPDVIDKLRRVLEPRSRDPITGMPMP